jgi:hypothetical protein
MTESTESLRSRGGLLIGAIAALAALSGCNGDTGSKAFAAAVKDAIGLDVKDYQALSYPTNSFGVVTTYKSPGQGKAVADGDFLCATWKCLGVEAAAAPTNADDVLAVRLEGVEYAAKGQGGTIKLTAEHANEYALKVVLPKVQQVLNLGVGLDSKSVVKVELELGPATKRLLSKPDFLAYLEGSKRQTPTKIGLQKAFAQGALVLVVGDVVINSIKATVTTSKEVAPSVDAKLGGLTSKVFSDAEASFKVTKKLDATYEVESTGPVVALRLLREQPGAGQLGASDEWQDWPVVKGPTESPLKSAL